MPKASVILIISLITMSSLPVSCAPIEPQKNSGIVMTTDKVNYVHGEPVKITVTNNSDSSIWYIGYQQPDLHFWEIEKAQENAWQGLSCRLPVTKETKEVCQLVFYEQPVGSVVELKPHSNLLFEWDQKLCLFETVTEPTEPVIVERGRYRFKLRYSLEIIKSKKIKVEPWERFVDLGETVEVYSNEFFLE